MLFLSDEAFENVCANRACHSTNKETTFTFPLIFMVHLGAGRGAEVEGGGQQDG